MITIIHGENNVESRKILGQKVEQAVKNGIEIVRIDGSKIGMEEVRTSTESGSLFGKNKLVVIENFLSSTKSLNKQKIIDYLSLSKFDNEIVLWEGKEINRNNFITGAQVVVFKVNQVIFRFLDSLRPGNSKEMLQLLTEAKESEDAEMIFYMLIRQARLLLMARDLGRDGLNELSEWQQSKFYKQSRFFSIGQLRDLYNHLLVIDFGQKTSTDVYSLSSRLDLLVANI